jgi:hypothetical protein
LAKNKLDKKQPNPTDDGVIEESVEIKVGVHSLHLPDDRLARPVDILADLEKK